MMNHQPQDPNNLERRRELQREEEAFRLREEERRLEVAKRSNVFLWMLKTIYFLVGALEILLTLRFILRVSGANAGNTFAQFIYNLSDPFVAPFSTLFISPTTQNGSVIFDLNVLIAMLVYGLLGWLGVWFVDYLHRR